MIAASREEAKRLGLKKYYASKSCPKGHEAVRYLSGGCVACKRELTPQKTAYNQVYWQKNKEDLSQKHKEYVASNRGRLTEYNKRYYERTRDSQIAAAKLWRQNNLPKAREAATRWRKNNLAHSKKLAADRRARVRQATLPLSPAEQDWMKFIYESCPPGFEVDHIHPLGGENVCGLHVPWNLQHLPTLLNRKKSNKVK